MTNENMIRRDDEYKFQLFHSEYCHTVTVFTFISVFARAISQISQVFFIIAIDHHLERTLYAIDLPEMMEIRTYELLVSCQNTFNLVTSKKTALNVRTA